MKRTKGDDELSILDPQGRTSRKRKAAQDVANGVLKEHRVNTSTTITKQRSKSAKSTASGPPDGSDIRSFFSKNLSTIDGSGQDNSLQPCLSVGESVDDVREGPEDSDLKTMIITDQTDLLKPKNDDDAEDTAVDEFLIDDGIPRLSYIEQWERVVASVLEHEDHLLNDEDVMIVSRFTALSGETIPRSSFTLPIS
jgi:hypothetical protein